MRPLQALADDLVEEAGNREARRLRGLAHGAFEVVAGTECQGGAAPARHRHTDEDKECRSGRKRTHITSALVM